MSDNVLVLQEYLAPLPDPFSSKNNMAAFTFTFWIPCRMSFVLHSNQKHIAKGILEDVAQLSQVEELQSHSPPLWGMADWRCSNKVLWNLSAVSSLLILLSKSLISHFSFISPVERELLLFNSSIKPWANTPCLIPLREHTALSLGSPELHDFSWSQSIKPAPFSLQHWEYTTSDPSRENQGIGFILEQTKLQNKSLIQIEIHGKMLL